MSINTAEESVGPSYKDKRNWLGSSYKDLAPPSLYSSSFWESKLVNTTDVQPL